MSDHKEPDVGTRVGIIRQSFPDTNTVEIFGYGEYQGLGLIKLDSGQTVLGIYGWWGPEEAAKEAVSNWTVKVVDPFEGEDGEEHRTAVEQMRGLMGMLDRIAAESQAE